MQKMIYNDPMNGSGMMDRVVRMFGYVPSKGMSDEPLAVVSFLDKDGKWRRLTWVPVSSLRPAPEKEGETDEKA